MAAGYQASKVPHQSRSGYLIQRADEKDQASLLQLLERYVTTAQAARRFDWIYKRNPQGQAVAWLALEPQHGQVVGFTSIFARQFNIAGESVVGGVGFDAFVRPDHRRRGIALALHQASEADMAKAAVPFRFMCGPPVKANLQALLKAGSQVVGGLRYLGLPLNTRGLLTMLHWHRQQQSDQSVALFDPLLAGVRRLLANPPADLSVRVVDRINYRFDRLWEELSAHFAVIGRRDGVYLDWRYLQNPVCWQQLVALEQRGRLVGWAVLEFAPQGCLLVDYLLPLDRQTGGAALSALIHYVAKQGASRLTLRFNPKGKYIGLFCRHGFLPGWSVEHLQVLCPHKQLLPTLLNQPSWHFSNGDLNPESSPWSVNTAPQAEWTDPNYHCSAWPDNSQTKLSEGLLELHPQMPNTKI